MDGPESIGRLLILGGIVLAAVGVVLVLTPSIPFLGRLPGDIRIENGDTQIFIPLGTMIVVSVVLTVVLNVIARR